jgi:hypothetical protein
MHLLRPLLSNLPIPFLCLSIFLLVALTMLCRSLFSFAAFVLGLGGARRGMAAPGVSGPGGLGYIRYSTVTGYFLQDDPATDSSTFDYVCGVVLFLAILYTRLLGQDEGSKGADAF